MSGIFLRRMKQSLQLSGKKERGFTLVELLLVIVIIGILAGIAVPLYMGQRTRALEAEADSNLRNLRLVLEQRYADYACYAAGSPTPTCANGTFTLDQIKSNFSGFKPGDTSSLKFDYKLVIAGVPSATTFTATAKGIGGAVKDTKFCINQNNEIKGGSDCSW